MKTALYVATVARTYRLAIDDYKKYPKLYKEKLEWYKEEIGKCTYREFTTGFYFGKPDDNAQLYDSNTYVKNYTYLGTVEETDSAGRCRIEQKNKFSVGEIIEIMKPDGRNITAAVQGIYDQEGTARESAPHPKEILWVDLDQETAPYRHFAPPRAVRLFGGASPYKDIGNSSAMYLLARLWRTRSV